MLETAFWIGVFLMSVVVHEVCHGAVAYLLGDPTAKQAGRLTLNPLRHIDPLWTVIIPGLLFISTHGRFAIGQAKPVPVDFSRLGSPRRDTIFVAVAGPFANWVLANLLALGWRLTGNIIFLYAVYLNLGLCVFNLVPIPPLDGSRVIAALLPKKASRIYQRIESFGFLVIFALYFTGALFYFIVPVVDVFCRIINVPQLTGA